MVRPRRQVRSRRINRHALDQKCNVRKHLVVHDGAEVLDQLRTGYGDFLETKLVKIVEDRGAVIPTENKEGVVGNGGDERRTPRRGVVGGDCKPGST